MLVSFRLAPWKCGYSGVCLPAAHSRSSARSGPFDWQEQARHGKPESRVEDEKLRLKLANECKRDIDLRKVSVHFEFLNRFSDARCGKFRDPLTSRLLCLSERIYDKASRLRRPICKRLRCVKDGLSDVSTYLVFLPNDFLIESSDFQKIRSILALKES